MVEDQRFVPLLSVESAVDDAVDSEVCGGGVDAPPEEDDVTELMHKLCIIRKETDALVTDLMLSDVCELVAVLEVGSTEWDTDTGDGRWSPIYQNTPL
jgi:hypothetical protein